MVSAGFQRDTSHGDWYSLSLTCPPDVNGAPRDRHCVPLSCSVQMAHKTASCRFFISLFKVLTARGTGPSADSALSLRDPASLPAAGIRGIDSPSFLFPFAPERNNQGAEQEVEDVFPGGVSASLLGDIGSLISSSSLAGGSQPPGHLWEVSSP